MCYDIHFKVEINQLADYFHDLIFDEAVQVNFNFSLHIQGHAFAAHPIIYKNKEDEKLHCKMMEWGCIPFYVKTEKDFVKPRSTMLNARSEKILDDTKSYWHKIRNRRCLVPVTGFYEHREITGWKNKVPYFIALKDQSTFFLPGLYSVAELADTTTGEMYKKWTFTIITRKANEIMKQIHNGGDNSGRMPLLLPFEMSKKWVESELSDEEYKLILDYEMPSDKLDYHTVASIRARQPRADGKQKDELFVWEKMPEIILK